MKNKISALQKEPQGNTIRSALDKNPMPGHLFEGNPVDEGTTRRDNGNLISGSSAFSKTSLIIRKFTVHVVLKPGLENFEHYFTSV